MNLDDYIQFVERPSSELYSIKVVQGPYLGVIYTYGKVQVKENRDLDQATFTFDFQIEKTPENLNKEKLKKSTEFKNFMGDILVQLIEDKANSSCNKPSIEVFNEWLDEWSKTTGISKYNVYLTGAFCQNYFFGKTIDTDDVDVTLELKSETDVDYYELKNILEQAIEIGLQKNLSIDIYVVEDPFKFTDKIITVGKDLTKRSDTELWNENANISELIPGLYEITEDSKDAYNKYLSKDYEVLSKKLI